ncbi:MAG: PaaI family thioesterase [Candidatus Cloacimonetes bacterium]|jgi:acyl-coenzyme A thioesterase PaaI-like protein|nr:PaaI family thioesterase [Candidatus Cloacimonadota bacterium]
MGNKEYQKCFVCGKENPIGLKVDFTLDESGIAQAKLIIASDYEGYPGVVHGGIISTLLDEAMAKAVFALGKAAFTANMNLKYRRQLPSNTPIILEGKIVQDRGRMIKTQATIFDKDGVFAEAEALFVLPRK